MLRYILLTLAIYFAYRFIVELVIPIYKTTKQVKKQFEGIKEQQRQYQDQQTGPQEQHQSRSKINDDDYLDFEEIK
ncbi:MAG: hypothetical protein ACK5AO_09945 [bacterium]